MGDKQTTVRVRILVAVDDRGQWSSGGYHLAHHKSQPDPREWMSIDDLTEHLSYHWIEADIPVPTITTIEGQSHAE